jgi:hypothetical protein
MPPPIPERQQHRRENAAGDGADTALHRPPHIGKRGAFVEPVGDIDAIARRGGNRHIAEQPSAAVEPGQLRRPDPVSCKPIAMRPGQPLSDPTAIRDAGNDNAVPVGNDHLGIGGKRLPAQPRDHMVQIETGIDHAFQRAVGSEVRTAELQYRDPPDDAHPVTADREFAGTGCQLVKSKSGHRDASRIRYARAAEPYAPTIDGAKKLVIRIFLDEHGQSGVASLGILPLHFLQRGDCAQQLASRFGLLILREGKLHCSVLGRLLDVVEFRPIQRNLIIRFPGNRRSESNPYQEKQAGRQPHRRKPRAIPSREAAALPLLVALSAKRRLAGPAETPMTGAANGVNPSITALPSCFPRSHRVCHRHIFLCLFVYCYHIFKILSCNLLYYMLPG